MCKESLTFASAVKEPPAEPLFFLKPPSAALGTGAAIVYPAGVTRHGQWTRAKGFDTFASSGPVITLDLSPLDLAFSLRVNGEVRQQARSSQMHFGIARLIASRSRGSGSS